MAYKLHYEDRAKADLRGVSLSRTARVRLYANLHADLSGISDGFRANPSNRLPAPSPYFVYRLILQDGGRLHTFVFHVDDSGAVYGVLSIVYVEHFPPRA